MAAPAVGELARPVLTCTPSTTRQAITAKTPHESPTYLLQPRSPSPTMPTLRDLPQDVLDDVLLALPDFDALAAAVLSSRLFYDVFAAHPRSTVLAIAYNLVGPALPQAVAALHWSFDGVTGLTVVEQPLARYAYVCLKENTNVVARFEDLFSLRYVATLFGRWSLP